MPAIQFQGRLLDARPDRIDLRDREYQPELRSLPAEYPQSWAIEYYLPQYSDLILDQGSDGSCTGFGLACLVNYLHWTWGWREALRFGVYGLENLPDPNVVDLASPHMLYEIARVYDEWPGEDYEGSSCRGAMKGWNRHGVCSEALWPATRRGNRRRSDAPQPTWQEDAATRPLGAYYRVDTQSIADMQSAIFEVGAVYASALVHVGWQVEDTDQLPLPVIPCHSEIEGGHAFALVGFVPQGFIVQNSWGADWGYHGFAVLPYEDWIANGMDAWVAVLGAPTRSHVPITLVRVNDSSHGASLRAQRGAAEPQAYVYQNDEVQPWTADDANLHTLVLGNNGIPLNRIVEVNNANEAVRRVARDRIGAWLSENSSHRHVVLYGHGGLTSEEDAMRRVQVMGPYYLANGIYPLFINWRTGILETFQYLTADAIFGVERTGLQRYESALDGVRDWLGSVGERAREAADRTLEVSAEQVVKPFWTQMKQNAAAAAWQGHGTQLVAQHLLSLKQQFDDLQIHMVGHSAGALLLGNMLPLLASALEISSCTLWAPACTVQFALDTYAPAVDAGTLKPGNKTFAIEILDDARERADSAGPYGKSILYLVSRALEDYHKTPVLGLERVWNQASETQPWARETADSVKKWTQFCKKKRIHPTVISAHEWSNGPHTIPSSHGNFDNDAAALERCIRRILNKAPRYPVENLSGY